MELLIDFSQKPPFTTPLLSFIVTPSIEIANGFFGIDNLPVVNGANAPQAMGVRFSLSGNKGLNIFASGYPASSPVACDASEPSNTLDESNNPGNRTMTYDSRTDQYSYNWKTDKAWKGTCRIFVVKLKDGTEHLAKFKFK